jgi:transcriptional regulator of acetoin/glycerol metabolism
MENSSASFGGPTRVAGRFDAPSRLPEDCRLARSAGVNLLVVLSEGVNPKIAELLLAELAQPVASWRPGERLVLPQAAQARTLILHDVGALPVAEQRRLIEWLEGSGGHTQVVSTTPIPLLPRVQAGEFLARLYYRLNTVCVDVNVTA